MESAILDFTMTTGNLLRQKQEAVTLSHKSRDHFVGISPIWCLRREIKIKTRKLNHHLAKLGFGEK